MMLINSGLILASWTTTLLLLSLIPMAFLLTQCGGEKKQKKKPIVKPKVPANKPPTGPPGAPRMAPNQQQMYPQAQGMMPQGGMQPMQPPPGTVLAQVPGPNGTMTFMLMQAPPGTMQGVPTTMVSQAPAAITPAPAPPAPPKEAPTPAPSESKPAEEVSVPATVSKGTISKGPDEQENKGTGSASPAGDDGAEAVAVNDNKTQEGMLVEGMADDPGAYQTLADLNAEDLFAKK